MIELFACRSCFYPNGDQTKTSNRLLSSMLTEHVQGFNGEGECRAIHESYMNQKEEKLKKNEKKLLVLMRQRHCVMGHINEHYINHFSAPRSITRSSKNVTYMINIMAIL